MFAGSPVEGMRFISALAGRAIKQHIKIAVKLTILAVELSSRVASNGYLLTIFSLQNLK
jgi:hypothetical protein